MACVSGMAKHCLRGSLRISFSSIPRSVRIPCRPDAATGLTLKSVQLTAESLSQCDAVLLITDHSAFPYDLIHRASPLIVDSRNAFRQFAFMGAHLVGA